MHIISLHWWISGRVCFILRIIIDRIIPQYVNIYLFYYSIFIYIYIYLLFNIYLYIYIYYSIFIHFIIIMNSNIKFDTLNTIYIGFYVLSVNRCAIYLYYKLPIQYMHWTVKWIQGKNFLTIYLFSDFAAFQLMPINNRQACWKSINNWSKNIFERRFGKNTKSIKQKYWNYVVNFPRFVQCY